MERLFEKLLQILYEQELVKNGFDLGKGYLLPLFLL
jgi:hypothetical protein